MTENGRSEEREVEALGYAASKDASLRRSFWSRRTPSERFALLCALALVAGAIGFILILPNFSGTIGKPREDMARAQVAGGGALANAIELYRMYAGRPPVALVELTTRPADPELDKKIGELPLIQSGSLQDPWKNPYQYLSPGTHNRGGYDLWSMGADGVSGTADDIGNW